MRYPWFFGLGLWCCLLPAGPAAAENWPGWRGPRGDGTSLEKNVLLRWNGPKGENVAWKVEIPGKGHASPIVWDDRIFLVTAREDREERILLCLDRASGKMLWQQVVVRSPLERKHGLNSYASSTPATDGRQVYVAFLDRASGKTVWKTPRENKTRSYCVPIIRQFDGRTQMILSGSKCVASYDPHDGRRHWIIDGPTEQFVASLIDNGKLLFMTAGFPDFHILAIRQGRVFIRTEKHLVALGK